MNATIGIDPGLDGFVAIVEEDKRPRAAAAPTIQVGRKRKYDVREMVRIIQGFVSGDADYHVTIEKQQAFRGQGVTSTFSIGQGFGLWEGIVAGLGLPYEIVGARTWKSAMLMDIPGEGADKGRSILAASRLWPGLDLRKSEHPNCKPHDGKAEACLIAEWGRRKHYGGV